MQLQDTLPGEQGRPAVGASSRKWTTLTAAALKLRVRLGLLAGMTPGLACLLAWLTNLGVQSVRIHKSGRPERTN